MSDVVPAGIIMIGVRDSGIEKDADQILNPSHDKENQTVRQDWISKRGKLDIILTYPRIRYDMYNNEITAVTGIQLFGSCFFSRLLNLTDWLPFSFLFFFGGGRGEGEDYPS